MTSLTPRRRKLIEPILAEQLAKAKQGGADASDFETQLKDALAMSYREIHKICDHLLKDETYAPIAAIILENSAEHGGPRVQYTTDLAKLYGVTSYHNDKNLRVARAAWFEKHGIPITF